MTAVMCWYFPHDTLIYILFVVNQDELKELIINDGKGGFGTFCDEGMLVELIKLMFLKL